MAGVIAQRDGRAVGGANAAVGAQDQEFFAAQHSRVPAHAGVLRPAEQIAGGACQQHFGVMGSVRSRAPWSDHRWTRRPGIENVCLGDVHKCLAQNQVKIAPRKSSVVRQADEQLCRCHAERNAPRFWARGVEAPMD